MPGIKNLLFIRYYIEYSIKNEKIEVSYKIKPGTMNSSLGIELYKSLQLETNLPKIVDIFGKLKIDLRKIEDDTHLQRMEDLRIKRQSFEINY